MKSAVASVIVGILAAWSAPALAAPESCAEYIASQPQEPYSPPGAEDDTDRVYAWYEPRIDDPVVIIDGRRLEGPQELIDRLYASDSPLFVIAHANMAGWDLSEWESPVQGLCFFRSNLRNTRWDGRDLSHGAFVESDLAGASFIDAEIKGVLIRDSNLASVKMRGANLSGGRLAGGWFADLVDVRGVKGPTSGLNGWDLSGANLTGFVFDCGIEVHNGCPVERGIDFSRADLTGANLARFPGWGRFNLSGARINGTQLALGQLVHFSSADFVGETVIRGRTMKESLDPGEARMAIATFRASEDLRRGPAFDCNRADQPVERMICSEEGEQQGLWLLDRRLSSAYTAARARDPRVADVQKAWTRLRAQCKAYDCLVTAYERRLTSLLGTAGVPPWLKRGERALFVESDLSVDRRYFDDPFMQRLWPLVADSASQVIVVTHESDGTLSVLGRAIGANAHTCYINASGLTIDPDSGWLSTWSHPDRPVPAIRMIGDELFVIANGRPDPEVYPDADFVSCGARASFEAGGHLPADRKVIESILADSDF